MPRAPFRAYSVDGVIDAVIELRDDARLTDRLNAAPTITLYDVHVYALEDGREVAVDEFEFDLAELHAVEAPQQQQTWERHVHTRAVRVEVRSGPYRITGHVHGPTGGDPVHGVTRRPPMVPLTEATLEFEFAGRPVTVESEVMIF